MCVPEPSVGTSGLRTAQTLQGQDIGSERAIGGMGFSLDLATGAEEETQSWKKPDLPVFFMLGPSPKSQPVSGRWSLSFSEPFDMAGPGPSVGGQMIYGPK